MAFIYLLKNKVNCNNKNKRKIKNYYNIFQIKDILFISILLLNLFIYNKFYHIKYLSKSSNESNNLLRKINKYIIDSISKKNIHYKNNISLNPKITALVLLFNSEKTIKNAVRTIQNQNMTEIEILLIDDNSSDNSLRIIKNLQKEDQRIRILKNKKNSGCVFSRSIGVLLSRGKYIIFLDSDDLFVNQYIFNICYNQLENNNIDIIEFSAFYSNKKILRLNNNFPPIPYYLKKKKRLIVKQPELFNSLYKKKNGKIIRLLDGYICFKCIKTKTYIKTLKIIGKQIYQQYINYGEDRIINFILIKVANSFRFIEEFGILYIKNPLSIIHSYRKQLIAHDELINLINIKNIVNNSSLINIISYEINYRWKKIFKEGLNEDNCKYIKYLINYLLNSQYINKNDKNQLINYL